MKKVSQGFNQGERRVALEKAGERP